MINIILSLIVTNFLILYFYSVSSIVEKILRIKIKTINKILIGYAILTLVLNFLYLVFKIEPFSINIFLLILFSGSIFFLKSYVKKFFFTKKNLFLNLVIIILIIPAILFGEQFYIFRGNYWDSSNYLSSALLMNEFNYSDILNKNYPYIFFEFQNMDRIVTGRPIVNYILSLFLNIKSSIFFIYYFFKCFISGLIFLSLYNFLNNKNILKFTNTSLLLSFIFIFSFWNVFILEIDALSHLFSIPLVLIVTKFIFEKNQKNNLKEKYFFITIISSTIFIIYPEIIFLIILFFLVNFIFELKNFNKKEFLLVLLSFSFFVILTIPSFTNNYEYLIFSQFKQVLRVSNWWGYYGGFILGKDNLILDESFVLQLKNNLNTLSFKELIQNIHHEHFLKKYYFIYLNIIPSAFGLYFLSPGKIENNLEFLYLTIFVIFLIFYILKIILINVKYLHLFKNLNKKLYSITIIFLIIFCVLILNNNFWSIIKIYSFTFPFLFIFLSINFKEKKINFIYVFLISIFCIYKYSIFNSGIGRYDSFPSILNPKLKKEINWNFSNELKINSCKSISFNKDNYIIKAYLNLMLINEKRKLNDDNLNSNVCNVFLKNKEFSINGR